MTHKLFNYANERYQRNESLTSSTCSVVNGPTLAKVNTKRKLIFTVGEGTTTSWVLCDSGKLDDLIDHFKWNLSGWLLSKPVIATNNY